MLVDRRNYRQQIEDSLVHFRVTALLGPRQCGKTTLARRLVSAESLNYLDLEDPTSLARLDEPMTALAALTTLASPASWRTCPAA